VSRRNDAGGARLTAARPAQLDEHRRALHALNRLGFGPRPGEVQRVLERGVDPWVEQQLDPDRIDDALVSARLTEFPTLAMSAKEITARFPTKLIIRGVARGRRPFPADIYEHAVYRIQVARYQDRYERRRTGGDLDRDSPDPPPDVTAEDDSPGAAPDRLDSDAEQRTLAKAAEVHGVPPAQRMQAILRLTPAEQRDLSDLGEEERDRLVDGMPPSDREAFQAMAAGSQVPVDELIQAKLIRAIYSERQLFEVMVDFWFNHFNVFAGKGADAFETTVYEHDVIRPHALGKFEDLLVATATSPAMLVYLDNWESVGPGSRLGEAVPPDAPRRYTHRRRHDLNENYGRELLELHTLGVDGGYSQKDVTEVARAFTGWTVDTQMAESVFRFDPHMHEPGSKTVLGKEFRENGKGEGLEVLHMLATHPATARFISKKLAMRFVSDEPSPVLVDSMAERFLRTDGDIREVLRSMFRSPEFWAKDAYRAKLKTPFEFVVSSIRATGADVRFALPLGRTLRTLGMPLFGMQAPTGYSTSARAWANSAALIGRVHFAMALASDQVPGVTMDPRRPLSNGQGPSTRRSGGTDAVGALEDTFLGGDVSPSTHAVVLGSAAGEGLDAGEGAGAGPDLAGAEAMILESPEFEKR
jgi:uncharacterized protein (DUF1800 family)